MNILFVHQNFPGQYLHLAPALAADPRNQVLALSTRTGVSLPGVRIHTYRIPRQPTPNIHPWLAEQEVKVLRGEAVARAAMELRGQGFSPDVICVHPGWGEALFLKDVWPESRMLGFCEFYYQARGGDVGFDPEFSGPPSEEDLFRLRLKNAHNLISLDAADLGVAPTNWQRSRYPREYQDRIEVVFDGIDTDAVRPKANAVVGLRRDEVKLTKDDEVVTFTARNLEPYRGVHVFMRALPDILRNRPKARAIIIGGDDVSYGRKPPPGQTYRRMLLDEVGKDLDMSRVHFVGKVPYQVFLDVLRISSVHVYLTYPFVLSWSMLEAMSAECLVVGSATAPVREVIRHGENGLLVDFFDVRGLADTVAEALADGASFTALRRAARRTVVERYDLKTVCLPRHLELVQLLAEG
ncbi:Glycosyltransferase involved in cell wall bisynthesis [Desulfonatronum zhilinae]|nr:Glycosyltransferase involved in cell wall bisynthesis [Desulfonatronum zhilinae]